MQLAYVMFYAIQNYIDAHSICARDINNLSINNFLILNVPNIIMDHLI